jgi:predicted DNA-binding transcriptional regulator AlpA
MAFSESRPGRRLLRRSAALARVGVGATTFFEGIRRGIYPPPVELRLDADTKRATSLWVEDELDAAVERLIAVRDEALANKQQQQPLSRPRAARGRFAKAADIPAISTDTPLLK